MALINCKKCGKLMVWKKNHLCDECLQLLQEDVKKIKAYLATHPRASIMEVERMTGVSLKTIREIASDYWK